MNNGSRIALVITGAIASLIAVALVAGGGLALWGDSLKDDDGYLRTDTERFSSGHTGARHRQPGRGPRRRGLHRRQRTTSARSRCRRESRDGKPVFVGIARTSDVERYLGDVPYTTVNDIDVTPFRADYERHSGNRHPVAPEHAGIWQASS